MIWKWNTSLCEWEREFCNIQIIFATLEHLVSYIVKQTLSILHIVKYTMRAYIILLF